ncbi:superoxide dismutase [Streptomyces sp. A7024]|uniref:Superoxide dismutase n=1 Tax=Streptomyces coryli TaxID=1128680 RepID=A0A6G4TSC8_9ACTN|nr:superoxide dismutase [Streptomyces coryli]NGN62376.1 superoxide dismutase [Streptomyces coryli]
MRPSLARPTITRRRLLAASAAAAAGVAVSAPAARAGAAPTTIRLPDGFRPEGIAIGPGPYAYFGSLADGAVYRVELATGRGAVLGPAPGAPTVGLTTDRHGRIFASGGPSGQLRVVSAADGTILKTYQAGTPDQSFVNDVVLTPDAAYFTDSFQPRLYALRLGHRGGLPTGFDTVPLSGDWVQAPPGGFSANGITRTPDGSGLLMIDQTLDGGGLVRVDPATGVARRVDLGPARLPNGDGMLLLGRTLYVVQNRQNAIDVFRLDPSARKGSLVKCITDPRFDIPTTVARFRDRLYLPNARFSTEPTPQTPYTAVAVRI